MLAPSVAPQPRGTHLLMFKGFIPWPCCSFCFFLCQRIRLAVMIRHRPYAHHKNPIKSGVSALQNSHLSRCVCAHRVSVCQCFTAPFYFIIRYMSLPYGGLFADWRVLPPISGCLGCTIRSCKYVCNTIRHRSVKNHRSNPAYIS